VRSKRLYPIKELSWGFIRPDRKKRGRGARTLAYAQSEWIFEYVVEKKKYDAIIKMLNGFRDGWTQAKVFKEVLDTTEEQFDKDFRAWAIKQIESWGFDPKPQPRMRAAAARKILETKPKDPRALAVVGSNLARQKKYDEAIAIARRLEEVKPRSPEAARILADCYLAKRRWPEAIAALESYKLRRRLDPYGYKKLAKLYMQMGHAEKALPNLAELHRRTMKDPKYARQIADIYRTAGKNEQALHYYNQVLNINPYDAGVHKAMTGLHVASNNYDCAIQTMRSACLTDPKNADSWTQLAMVYYRAAQASKKSEQLSEARAAAQKALELDPQSQAKEILQMIDEYSNQ
jgi:tetratricopeptide (TPR) repeat protein